MAFAQPGQSFAIGGQVVAAPALAAGLYIVATPIGHLGDVTLRALATLAAADVIACEDTRITVRLTRHYAIATPLTAYHEHNAGHARPKLLAMLAAGKTVALCSDAGTPLVSDPGYRLVREAAAAGFPVIPIPGASALLAGLTVAGLPTDAFFFAGFLPPRSAARRRRLDDLATVPGTLVFYESPHRTAEALADMTDMLGPGREAAVARELTKTFETVRRGTLAELAAAFGAEPDPKGEVTILVGPPLAVEAADTEVDAALLRELALGSVGAAASAVAALTGRPRRELYARALALRTADADRADGSADREGDVPDGDDDSPGQGAEKDDAA